jgi:DnaJ family protein C protein 17
LLIDPLRRLALDAKLRLREAQKARLGKYDAKRKALVEELEERERAFKKTRTEQRKEEADRLRETERIIAEGRRMMEEKEKAILKAEEEMQKAAEAREAEMAPPALGAYPVYYFSIVSTFFSSFRSA